MFATTNPINNELVKSFPELDPDGLKQKLRLAGDTFHDYWKRLPITQRAEAVCRVAEQLRARKEEYARLMTLEMGKLHGQGVAEIEKCAWLCDYLADQAPAFLADRMVETEYEKSFVHYEPVGAVLGIMPWNFPFWQAFRFGISACLAGNVILLKPAPNVPQCGLAIEEMFRQATGRAGVFQTLLLSVEDVPQAIADPLVQGVAVTGSDRAGAAVAETAGKHIKKCVLELGGSDAFIVLDDADLDRAVEVGVASRMNNAGQTCIAAKRFIVADPIADQFEQKLIARIAGLQVGDPADPDSELSVMARPDLVDTLERQVRESVSKGARTLLAGGPGQGNGNFFHPVILTNIQPGMPAYEEELFGPVISLFRVKHEGEAIALANDSRYGLGAAIWSKDLARAERVARQLEVGAVAVNDMVKSDPRLPFGGVKRSGFGRELSVEGIHEFVNIKSIVISG